MVETVVQFNRIEMPRVKVEHLIGGKLWRIEDTEPVLVMPTRCADKDPRPHAGHKLT